MDLKERDIIIDELELVLYENLPLGEAPVRHFFAEGMYGREMSSVADQLITSQVHRYDHEFILSKGKILIWIDGQWELFEAPYRGITKAGTRRIGYVIEDCVWTTYHFCGIMPEDDTPEAIEKAVELIGEKIIMPYENKYLQGTIKNNILVKTLQDV